jgi:SAM-dependent methyltransferase
MPIRILIRPVTLKNREMIQITEYIKTKAHHRNISQVDGYSYIFQQINHYEQVQLYSQEADYHIRLSQKGDIRIRKTAPTRTKTGALHNRLKPYLLQEGEPIPFLIELGIMSAHGKIKADKQHKFRQINRFLEMVADILPHLPQDKTLHILDFGCGKAYLTFALFYYFRNILKKTVKIHGLDLKQEVIEDCSSLARRLEYEDLTFSLGDIKAYTPSHEVDLVITLHACDTATDAALEKAIRWKSKVILTVPCCQKELFPQLHNATLNPLLKHGILKERFAALATDAARALLLEILGYSTDVIEFIDLEHTPKNLLIRSIRKSSLNNKYVEQKKQEYHAFKEMLQITPSLESYFSKEV